jgi:hypothetical protein
MIADRSCLYSCVPTYVVFTAFLRFWYSIDAMLQLLTNAGLFFDWPDLLAEIPLYSPKRFAPSPEGQDGAMLGVLKTERQATVERD